jgi:hypothetical protein
VQEGVNLQEKLAAIDEASRGVEHCPRADGDAEILLIEPRGTLNTGDSDERAAAAEVEI